jgi:hypothetical protein
LGISAPLWEKGCTSCVDHFYRDSNKNSIRSCARMVNAPELSSIIS